MLDFIPSLGNNDSMKPCEFQEHLIKIHNDKKDKDLTFFKQSKKNS